MNRIALCAMMALAGCVDPPPQAGTTPQEQAAAVERQLPHSATEHPKVEPANLHPWLKAGEEAKGR